MTTEIEKTHRALCDVMDRVRRAGKHRRLTLQLEDALKAHLEEIQKFEYPDLKRRLAAMTEERDGIQGRLHAIDHAYFEQSQRNGEQARQIEKLEELNHIAGEELIRVQEVARQNLEYLSAVQSRCEILSDAYEYQKQLTRSACVAERESWVQIRELTGLVTSQRQAIADLYLAGRRANSAVATLQRLGYTDCGEAKS